ncbi:MAG: hypothetical protein Crog4KO_02170 [Crocinitomicaceae bacterium]
MKMKTLFVGALFALLTFGSIAQDDYKDVANIEVTGTARLDIMPDEIFVSITLRERSEGKDKISVEEQEKQMKAGLQSIGISLDDLTLSDSESDYVRISWRKREVISSKEYRLKLSTAEQVSKVFEKLDELEINDAYISKTEHSNIVELKKQLRIDAIKAAKEKADYLLKAIGEETGHALEIRENPQNYGSPNSYSNVQRYYANSINLDSIADDELPEIGFSKIRIEASIYVKFEIKQD